MPYLHEWPVSKKHIGRLMCSGCGMCPAEVQFLIQKRRQATDSIKNFCGKCRQDKTLLYEALTGCKKEKIPPK